MNIKRVFILLAVFVNMCASAQNKYNVEADFPGQVMSIFTKDAEVIRNGIVVLRMVAVSEPIYGALIMMEGIFNGVGNTKTTFIVGVTTMWIVRVLMTYICIHVFHLGLVAVWSCMIAENVTKATIIGILYLKGVWKKGAVRYS